MPNATIAAGMAISLGNTHLHRRQDHEVEDVVEDSRVLKEIQRMLL